MSATGWGSELTVPVSPERDHIRGNPAAPVTLLEYGDFQCPFCGAAHPVVEAVRRAAGDMLQFAFRHFPLTTVHPYAQLAAEAAEAAGAQGQFWPMHDMLFENQSHLEGPGLVARAKILGLDVDRFERELVDHTHAPRVQEDFLTGVYSGVNGTPSFFLNGQRYDGPRDPQSMLAAVEQVARVSA